MKQKTNKPTIKGVETNSITIEAMRLQLIAEAARTIYIKIKRPN